MGGVLPIDHAWAPYLSGPMALVMFVPSVVCGYLAYWQYERKKWKDALITQRSEGLLSEAKSVYSLTELQDYTKVSASGIFLHDKSIFVGPRPRNIPGSGIQSGFFLITPLYDAKRNGSVMVNRGWVPKSWERDLQTLIKSAPPNPKQPDVVTGIVQPSESPSAVVPDNVPDRLEFHWIDVPNLARACGLPPDTPLVQAISDDPLTEQQMKRQSPLEERRDRPFSDYGAPKFPIPKNAADMTRFSTMPVDHMMYSLTWATLCLALGLMARQVVFFPRKYRRIIDVSNKKIWKNVTRDM